jgi:CRISPR-associated endoribonuclease Cas6
LQYHCHLQGFIYNLLKGSIYDQLHDSEGSKFFSFSNIFPFNDIRQNDIRNLIIASPDEQFIRYLYDILQVRRAREISIGNMKFKINFLQELYRRIPDSNSFNLITGTPIIIRIPREKYKQYGYESIYENFTYWKNEHPIDVFITQLTNNLLKKYTQYHTQIHDLFESYEGIKVFDTFKFKKQISTRVFMKGFEQAVIGTLWEFGFNNTNKDLVQFALDAGLGERNSLGFGFMNLPLTFKTDIYKESTSSKVHSI